MTGPSEHEAYLRAALHAAADSLEPRSDGLERITARLRHARPQSVVWLTAAWDALRLRIPAGLQDAFYWLSSSLWAAWDALQRHTPAVLRSASSPLSAALWAAWDRFAPASARGKHRSTAQGWLRPLAAMAVVVFIVAAGTYVAIDISTAVSPSSTNLHQQNGKGSGGGPAGPQSPQASHPNSLTGSGHPAPSQSCRPGTSPSPGPSGSWTCEPTASPQPSSSATPNPSPSPSDSASPTPPPSPTPGAS